MAKKKAALKRLSKKERKTVIHLCNAAGWWFQGHGLTRKEYKKDREYYHKAREKMARLILKVKKGKHG